MLPFLTTIACCLVTLLPLLYRRCNPCGVLGDNRIKFISDFVRYKKSYDKNCSQWLIGTFPIGPHLVLLLKSFYGWIYAVKTVSASRGLNRLAIDKQLSSIFPKPITMRIKCQEYSSKESRASLGLIYKPAKRKIKKPSWPVSSMLVSRFPGPHIHAILHASLSLAI